MSDEERMALIKKAVAIHQSPEYKKYFSKLCDAMFGADMMKTIYDMDHPDEISFSE